MNSVVKLYIIALILISSTVNFSTSQISSSDIENADLTIEDNNGTMQAFFDIDLTNNNNNENVSLILTNDDGLIFRFFNQTSSGNLKFKFSFPENLWGDDIEFNLDNIFSQLFSIPLTLPELPINHDLKNNIVDNPNIIVDDESSFWWVFWVIVFVIFYIIYNLTNKEEEKNKSSTVSPTIVNQTRGPKITTNYQSKPSTVSSIKNDVVTGQYEPRKSIPTKSTFNRTKYKEFLQELENVRPGTELTISNLSEIMRVDKNTIRSFFDEIKSEGKDYGKYHKLEDIFVTSSNIEDLHDDIDELVFKFDKHKSKKS